MFDTPQDRDLYGQAGRQVFFFAVSVYGWASWQRARTRARAGGSHGGAGAAVVPRWASARERAALAGAAVIGVALFTVVLARLGSFGPLADAWIFTGSLLATYGMARGYVEFWLVWIAVDVVGVPLLVRAGYYPSALLYVVYGAFCVWGFIAWARVRRAYADRPQDHSVEAVA